MIRVAALTSGRFEPASRHRFRQYFEKLREVGIQVDEFLPAIGKYNRIPGWPKNIRQGYAGPFLLAWLGVKLAARLPGILGSWNHQITWLERSLLPGVPSLEYLLKGPLVLDVDDAVWLEPPMGSITMRLIAKRATIVLAGNNYIADWFSNFCKDVRVLPTAIDIERYIPADTTSKNSPHRFNIGWIGTSGNLPYLQMIEKPLGQFLFETKDARLLVMADYPPVFKTLPTEQVCFLPWSEEKEVQTIQSMDVGLMPLPDNEWTRGKCSFKMLQYMACARPVIVSPVGMNTEILSLAEPGFAAIKESDWYDSLKFLYQNPERARTYGVQGRKIIERHFNSRIISQRLAEVFKGLI